MYSIARLHGRTCVHRKHDLLSFVKRRYKADDAGTTPKAFKDNEANALPSSNGKQRLPLWQRLGPLTKVFNGYGRAQNTRPYVTQAVTSVVIYFCGDLGAQTIGGDAYDPWRAARNMVIGAVVSIPAYSWCVNLSLHTAVLMRTQVHVSRPLLQLWFQAPFNRHQSRCQPNGLHTNLSKLILRHACSTVRRRTD